MTPKDTGFRFTGWHALGVFGGAFAIIITVNLFMAYNAISTFPGLETKNSYVSSQTFDARRSAQLALGWDVAAEYEAGTVRLVITDGEGRPVQPLRLDATLGRATHVQDDRKPAFVFDGSGFAAPETLAPGNWNIRMTATARDGTPFQQRVPLYVSQYQG